MSYFTETFNRILEFKGDIPAGYADRRGYERDTNSHMIGKKSAKLAKKATNTHYDNRSGDGSNAITNYKLSDGETTKDKYNNYNTNAEYYARKSHKIMDADREKNKARHSNR